MFGYIYPHMHFIIYSEQHKCYYLVCGATGEYIRIDDGFLDDLHFIIESKILERKHPDIVNELLIFTDDNEAKKLIEKWNKLLKQEER